MKSKLLFLAVTLLSGCDSMQLEFAAKSKHQAMDSANDGLIVIDSSASVPSSLSGADAGRPNSRAMIPQPLPIVGTWLVSGFMGDSSSPDGPLKRRLGDRSESSAMELVEEWVYSPTDANSRQGWVALAYQFPADNWGDRPGKNLAGQATPQRVTFRARSRTQGGMWVSFKSGGCTADRARYPASFESDVVTVHLAQEWKNYVVPLPFRRDMSNVPAAFSFTIERALNPVGGAFELTAVQFE